MDAVTIANSVNNLGTASPYYSLVHVNSFGGGTLSDPTNPLVINGIARGAPFYLANFGIENVFIFDTNINLGTVRVTGWDFSIGYTLDMKSYGTLQLGSNAVLYVNSDTRQFPNSRYISNKGFANTEGVGTQPQYKINALVEYRYQNWTLGFNYNYIPSTLNALFYVPACEQQPHRGRILADRRSPVVLLHRPQGGGAAQDGGGSEGRPSARPGGFERPLV